MPPEEGAGNANAGGTGAAGQTGSAPTGESGNNGGTLLGGGGSGSAGTGAQVTVPDWASSLPDELKSNPRLATYRDLPSYIKDAEEAQKLIGRKGVVKPGENATPEDLNRYYKELGRPDKAEQYGLTRPETWPQELQFSDALVPKVQEMFHKNGVTAEQAKSLWADYHQIIAESAGEQSVIAKTDVEKGLSQLKQEWGGEDKFNANIETAKMAVQQFGGEDLVKFLNETGLGDHPALIKAFAKAGAGLREDNFIGGGNHPGAMNADRAKAEIQKLTNDKAFTDILYSNKLEHKAQQKEAAMKWEQLHKLAYPGFS